jgi:hypothetical protein
VIFIIGNDGRAVFRSIITSLKQYVDDQLKFERYYDERKYIRPPLCNQYNWGRLAVCKPLELNLLWKTERTDSLKFKSESVVLVDASSSYLYGLAG